MIENKITKVVDNLVLCHASLMYIDKDVFKHGITLSMNDRKQYTFCAEDGYFTREFTNGFAHLYLSLLELCHENRRTLQKAVVLAACNVLEGVMVDLRDLFGRFSYVNDVSIAFYMHGVGIRVQYNSGTCIHTEGGEFNSVWDSVNQIVQKSRDTFSYARK